MLKDFLRWLLDRILGQGRTTPTTPGPTPGDASLREEMLRLHNVLRRQSGMNDLIAHPMLSAAAANHAAWMAAGGRLTHSNNTDPGTRIRKTGYAPGAWGENIAAGYNTADGAFQGWYDSAGHRRNMLGNYLHAGFGVADGGGRRWWCAVYASPSFTVSETMVVAEAGIEGPDILQ